MSLPYSQSQHGISHLPLPLGNPEYTLPEISILHGCSINHPPCKPSNRKMYRKMYMCYMMVYKKNVHVLYDGI
jgi:hypothetical protein